jgi:protein-tyrosine phosphatase
MVCMGNICRSPSAEGVLRARLEAAGLGHVQVDSAGTHDYHVGEPPDRRSQRHAARRGYDLSALRARQVERSDFERFDLILAMDEDNLDLLQTACPLPLRHKLMGLMAFAPGAAFDHVPDPYYGGPEDFERVLDLIEQACEGLLLQIRRQEA